MLLFKKKFLPAIRSGDKTQTIRLAKVCRYRSGQKSYIPGVGHIRITTVERIQLAQLDEQDARLDGFDSLAAMLAELQSLYGADLAEGVQVLRIRFEPWVEPAGEAAASDTSTGES